MKARFVDTSAWYAYFNRSDPDADEVQEALERGDRRLATSTYVFDELVTLTMTRRSHDASVRAGSLLTDPTVVRLERVTGRDEEAAWQRFQDRPDQGYSFTDCTSFVLMERLGIDGAIALDDDFAREGFDVEPGD